MDKILAIVVLIVVIWLGIPHIIHGQWIAPTAVAPNSWVADNTYPGSDYRPSDFAQASATPPQGFGWFRFDFWNNPSLNGEPATSNDLRLRPLKNEFQ